MPQSNSSNQALVVGAGLVGALWTVFLARKGYQVKVFERRADMRAEGYSGGRSINLAMSERGWKAIEKAGIRPQIEKVAIAMPGRMMHALDGKTQFQAYGKEGQAIYSVSRGGLNLELLRIAGTFPNVEFFFNQKCTDLDLQHPRISFENTETGAQTTHEAPLIFATDGAYSAVRYALQKTDRFNYKQQYLEHGYKELCIPPMADGSFRLDPNALHIWPRGHFMLIALPNADGSFTCTLFLPFEGPESFANLKSDADVTQFFQRFFPDALQHMPTLLEDWRNNPDSSLMTVHCAPWQWQNRVLLLGDAAHAIVPFFGQGMNAGFEDCTLLDEMHDELNGNWADIIPKFAQSRKPDGDAIAELALRNFIEMRDLVADPKFLLRKKIAAFLHEKHPDFLPVYSMVSFSHLPYSQALREDDRQNQMFLKMLEIPDIENNWQGPEVEQFFVNYPK